MGVAQWGNLEVYPMVRITHQHQMLLRNVQKNMVSSQNQVKISHAKIPGYQQLMQLLQLVLQLAQGTLYIE